MKQQDTTCADLLGSDEATYRRWRKHKFEAWTHPATAPIAIKSPAELNDRDIEAIKRQCRKTNICFYRSQQTTVRPSDIRALGQRLGLDEPVANPRANAQHISLIQETDDSDYIPYSDSALTWHTDGYYNDATHAIGSFIMHCVRPAKEGGINRYLDPDIIYILLRDENPEHIRTLMHPEAMTIPANGSRPAQSNPALASDADGNLLMRYTDRKRNITWRKECAQALSRLREIVSHHEKYQLVRQLKAGEGVICNNVLHDRSAFESGAESKRLLYRARYHKRLPDTGWQQLCRL